jgi:hypothetical protein
MLLDKNGTELKRSHFVVKAKPSSPGALHPEAAIITFLGQVVEVTDDTVVCQDLEKGGTPECDARELIVISQEQSYLLLREKDRRMHHFQNMPSGTPYEPKEWLQSAQLKLV